MKRLIVNADDFGITPPRNAGIIDAHRRGIVTSASLMAYGRAFAEAVRLAKATPSLDIGLHLNLSEGEPVVLGHQTLVDAKGRFLGKTEARRRANEGLFDPAEVAKEALAQLDTLLQAGLTVTHVDGHQHIHVFGSVSEPVAQAAAVRGLRWIRCPADTLLPPSLLAPERATEVEEYRSHAKQAAAVFARAGLRSTPRFGGIALSGQLTIENLIAVLKDLPDGLTELMVHPGLADTTEGFAGPDREKELQALTDPRLKILLRHEQVELTHFGKL